MTVIIETTTTTAGGGNVSRLKRHLVSDENESVRILNGNLGLLNTFEDIAQLAGHKYAFNHCVISPKANVSAEQLSEIVSSVLDEYGASEFCLVEHIKQRSDETNFPHFHLIFESTKDARVLSKKDSYLRNEFLSRKAELMFGMELGVGKHNEYVFDRLKEVGLMGENEVGGTLRKSQAFSKKQHQKANRLGINLPAIAREISQLGGGETFYKGLIQIEEKYKVNFKKGDTRNVILITDIHGNDAGAFNKVLGIDRKQTQQFFEELEQAKRKQFTEVAEQSENRVLVSDTASIEEDRQTDRVAQSSTSRDLGGNATTGRNIGTDMQEPQHSRREMHDNREPSSRITEFTQKIRTILSQRAFNRGVNRAGGYAENMRSIANSQSPEYPTIDGNAWTFLRRWAAAYAKSQGFRM